MRLPLDGSPRISTEYMVRGTGSLGKHLGLDWAVPVGTNTHAEGNGFVTYVGYGNEGGYQVELTINGLSWRHLHLQKGSIKVSVGQSVKEGQLIAKTGATGNVSGPHLHADVRVAGTKWNASLVNFRDPRRIVAEANEVKTVVRINKGIWNVRNGAGLASYSLGIAHGGQLYGPAEIMTNGWARIVFTGRIGYVAPSAFTKV